MMPGCTRSALAGRERISLAMRQVDDLLFEPGRFARTAQVQQGEVDAGETPRDRLQVTIKEGWPAQLGSNQRPSA